MFVYTVIMTIRKMHIMPGVISAASDNVRLL